MKLKDEVDTNSDYYSANLSSLYSHCTLCPNNCNVDRASGKVGRCGQTNQIRIAWVGLHKGEEPPISGDKGSGMIFFCGCPLHCQYCQNYQISGFCENASHYDGIVVSEDELSTLMLDLQNFGASSINLVTGTHYIPSIVIALQNAKKRGLTLPVVWNSSGYESVDALKIIDPFIDLYLLDAKTLSYKVASKFCGLSKYCDSIVPVMFFLKQQHPKTSLEGRVDGVLIRHLVFPGTLDSTMDFLEWFSTNFKNNFYLSLMTQFVPPLNDPGFPKITQEEYSLLLDALDNFEIDGFVQEMSDNEILWIPDFRKDEPFPKGFAEPLPSFLKMKESFAKTSKETYFV